MRRNRSQYSHWQAPRRWRQRLRHSLRWRLVALFMLLAFGTGVVFLGGTRAALDRGFEMVFKPLLSDYVDRLAAEIGSPPDVARAQALVARLPISVRIDSDALRWNSHPAQANRWGDDHDHSGKSAFLTRTTADGSRIQFGINREVWHGPTAWRGLLPLLGLLLLTWAAYAAVRRIFRPLDDIRAGALRYGEGRFDEPIPVRRRDELGDLAQQVNTMASGLHGMLQGQRALLLAISHELRSPLTRARLNAELSADSPERQALLRDLSLMSEMITDLLESERLAAGVAALKREPTDLNTLVREVVAEGFAGQPIELDLDPELAPLPLDRPRAAMLVRNLIDNALRHGGSGTVQVRTQAQSEGALLSVRDHGPGVPEELLSRLAEPFYRPDVARTRAAGGVGLGLYLCKLVAQSHGGSLGLRNASPGLIAEAIWRH